MRKKVSILTAIIVLSNCVSFTLAEPESLSTVTTFAEYNIDVTLHPETKSIEGREEVSWVNRGSGLVEEIYFYLYPNAFSYGSTFIKESSGSSRGVAMTGEGSMTVKSLKVNGETASFSYFQPDDNNSLDKTVGIVELVSPLEPGESVQLEFDFTVSLPPVFARMGYYKNFFMLGQWYPKIAAYELAGVRGCRVDGWNVHQYHGSSEFYGNFAAFEVKIKVPKEYTVGASGRLLSRAKVGEQVVYRYRSAPVHTFCWMADDNIIYEQRKQDFGNQNVIVHLYLQPEQEPYIEDYFDVIGRTMKYYNSLGDYPYENLTVVVPEYGASGAAGMEYPTLVLGADAGVNGLKGFILETLVHELAHQYFYGLVASNEKEEAWLDEGFTCYITSKAMNDAFGVRTFPGYRAQILEGNSFPLNLPAWEYPSFTTYALNVYTRAELVLFELERIIGSEKMMEFLQEYVERFKFGHPYSQDVKHVLEEVTGKSFDAFFKKYVYGSEMQDVGIVSLVTKKINEGYENRLKVTQRNLEDRTINVTLCFDDGSYDEYNYTAKKGVRNLRFVCDEQIVKVFIDPEINSLYLDCNLQNNVLVIEKSHGRSGWWSIFKKMVTSILSYVE